MDFALHVPFMKPPETNGGDQENDGLAVLFP